MSMHSYKAGELIYPDGSTGEEMFIVTKGKIQIYKTINGEHITLGFCEKGDYFGEVGLLLGGRRSASVVAVEDSDLLELNKSNVLDHIKKEPDFALMMLKKMAKRMMDTHLVISKIEGERKSLELLYKNR